LDEEVRIARYDPAWPARFEAERGLLTPVLAGWATGGIHHVGSTAVPGLDAKPIVDVLVGVDGLDESRSALEPPLHLIPTHSKRFRDELAFRDRLRADADLAASYSRLKRALAATYANDREACTSGKAEFIAAALATD
jgi:GrpB-like predicted nucleotidyltransferase (UPF0157 family)